MIRRPAVLLAAALIVAVAVGASAQERPKIGVAFGGGSAKGIAHVGVIRWFEEHRIPIDVAAGTSMGGLIGGCWATGMSAAELDEFLATMNLDELFGASNFAFKNVRRKAGGNQMHRRVEERPAPVAGQCEPARNAQRAQREGSRHKAGKALGQTEQGRDDPPDPFILEVDDDALDPGWDSFSKGGVGLGQRAAQKHAEVRDRQGKLAAPFGQDPGHRGPGADLDGPLERVR